MILLLAIFLFLFAYAQSGYLLIRVVVLLRDESVISYASCNVIDSLFAVDS